MRAYLPAALALAALTLAGCSSSNSPSSGSSGGAALQVIADVYPVAYAAQQVGGDSVEVTTLTPPGVEPHDLELTANQVKDIAAADLILYVPGMVPALDEAIAQQAQGRAVDVTTGIDRAGSSADQGRDPHVWLDPANMVTMGRTIAKAIGSTDAGVTPSPEKFGDEMTALATQYSQDLANCRIKPLVVSHEAFGFLAHAYGFQQRGISGVSPEAEPSPARMKEIADLVKAQGVTTIYFERLVSDKAAKAIAAETGASTALLDPIEGATDDKTYPQLMTQNLKTLVAGQDCR